MFLIDTHAHINFNAYKDDGDKVIRRALDEKIWMILVGAELKTSERAVDYANKYDKGVYAAVGLHPIHLFEIKTKKSGLESKEDAFDFLTRGEDFDYDLYKRMAEFEKVVAIGEIGLDYYHIPDIENVEEIKNKQKKVLLSQLELALELELPAIIHCRDAHEDMLEILKAFKKKSGERISKERPWGVMHCFLGDEELAWEYFNLGLLVSFNGLITFKNEWDSLIQKIPLNKLILETDCPFLTPAPFRGKRNEPVFMKYTANRISKIKEMPVEKIAQATTENARNLFGI